ncbi:Spo11/DNA topoisomerase VI subunit A [Bombardia bombarda]|uniref:DNA topoisomerase (ATP-hydrolyzing) n=1 Tax=Bombardia bombarda TaxID=252184 RepID=A0AA40CEQ8_9PEZI|nr:Spo11/DNA topoisomerase VI subunit A [Bombardia bombarda]
MSQSTPNHAQNSFVSSFAPDATPRKLHLARQTSSQSSATLILPNNRVAIPLHNSCDDVIPKIEDIMESIIDAVNDGVELVIPFRSTRPAQAIRSTAPSEREGRQSDCIKFPGRTIQEAKKFGINPTHLHLQHSTMAHDSPLWIYLLEALFRILELSHEALLSGNLITKRNIYYQNIVLFKSQSVVDELVDSLAFTLGVGRGDLNIVASAKGLITGSIELSMRDGSTVHCGLSRDSGILLPSINSIDTIDFGCTKWLLVIEKEATFRTLAASQYAANSRAGQGILVTAKGFPDLATRRFLHAVQAVRPQLLIFALVDFDPHGIAILRTYKNGSCRLEHEEHVTVPAMRWLGIRSRDIGPFSCRRDDQGSQSTSGQCSQDLSSQESATYSYGGSQSERPSKRLRTYKARDLSESITSLTQGDRKKAVQVMNEISAAGNIGAVEREQMKELKRMLMLNIKAEIQAVDNYGDITNWLNEKLCSA